MAIMDTIIISMTQNPKEIQEDLMSAIVFLPNNAHHKVSCFLAHPPTNNLNLDS